MSLSSEVLKPTLEFQKIIPNQLVRTLVRVCSRTQLKTRHNQL